MTIQYAILGLLSWKPLSGYDIKKIISDSIVFYWSGNNNQIYHTLAQLHKDGFVDQQIQYQESLPAKKVYSITEKGKVALREWLISPPQLPELRNTFLIRLAWSDQLMDEELRALLDKYEEEVNTQLQMQLEKSQRQKSAPNRSPRETFLWKKIYENIISSYQNELKWIREMRNSPEMKI